jgi:hypothetical protein
MTSQAAIDAFAAGTALSNVMIVDDKASIEANIGGLLELGSKIKNISTNDSGVLALSLNADQYLANKSLLGSVFTKTALHAYSVSGLDLDLGGTTLKAALADKRLSSMSVEGTASEVSLNFATLAVPANASKVSLVTVQDTANNVALTAAQFNATGTLQAKIKDSNGVAGNVNWSVSAAAVSDLSGMTGDARVKAVTVKDTAAALTTSLGNGAASLLNNAKVGSIAQTDGVNTISISYANYQNADVKATLDNKIMAAANVKVTNVTAAAAATVATGKVDKVTIKDNVANVLANWAANGTNTTTVEDTAANIGGANFAAFATDYATKGGSIDKINITDVGGKIELTKTEFNANQAMLKKVQRHTATGAAYSAATGFAVVTGLLAADVTAITKLASVSQVKVADSVAGAMANLKAFTNSKMAGSTITGLAADVKTNFDKLTKIGKNLTDIVVSDNNQIELTVAQFKASAFEKLDLTAGATIKVKDVGAADLAAVIANTDITEFNFKDKAVNFGGAMTQLIAAEAADTLTGITLSDDGTMTMTSAVYKSTGAQNVLDLVRTNNGVDTDLVTTGVQKNTDFSVALTQVLVADLNDGTFAGDNWDQVKSVSITDDATAIAGEVNDDLMDLSEAGKLSRINQSDAAGGRPAIAITYADLQETAIVKVLDKIYGKVGSLQTAGEYKLNVTDVAADQAKALNDHAKWGAKVSKMEVDDSSENIGLKLSDLKAVFDAGKLDKITDDGTGNIKISFTNFSSASYQAMLAKIDNGGNNYDLQVTDVTAEKATVTATNSHVADMTVRGAGASVGGKLVELNTLEAAGKLSAITVTDKANTINIAADVYTASKDSALSILNVTTDVPDGDYKLALSAVTIAAAADAADDVNADDHVVSYTASGEGAEITADLEDLELSTKLQVINRTDGGPAGDENKLALTGAEYATYGATLNKIMTNGTSGYQAEISALDSDDIDAALADANIITFDVEDDAEGLGANILAIQRAVDEGTKLTTVAQSDSDDIVVSYTDYTDVATARADVLSTMTWEVEDVEAGDLQALFDNDTTVNFAAVKDTAANIQALIGDATNGVAALDDNVAKLSGVVVSDNAVLELTGLQYIDNVTAGTGLLDKITNANGDVYHATITELAATDVVAATADDSVDSFTVKDKGAALTTAFGDLIDAGDKLTAVELDVSDDTDDTITISRADFTNTDEANGYVTQDYLDVLDKFSVNANITFTV